MEIFKNPQLHHLVNLLILLFISKVYAYLYLSWIDIFTILLFGIIIEIVLSWVLLKKLKKEPYSAVTTSIGVILMIYSPHLWLYTVLIALSLLQKYLIKIDNIHIFNPSNFAIVVLLTFFHKFGGLNIGTLGHSEAVLFLTLLLGLIILYRVNRWLLPIIFSMGYLYFEYTFVLSYDHTIFFEDIIDRFYSVSFIVFILFMLTDPVTTPEDKKHQAIFALLIALTASLLDRYFGFKSWHIFMALATVSPMTVLLKKRELHYKVVLVELTLIFITFYISQKSISYFGVPN